MPNAAPLPHIGLVLFAAGASLAGSSTTRTASSGALTTAAALSGSSTTATASSGALTTAAALSGSSTTSAQASGELTTGYGPAYPAPLPHLALLGGASTLSAATLAGSSVTTVQASGTLTVQAPLEGGSSTASATLTATLTVQAALSGSSATPVDAFHSGLLFAPLTTDGPMPLPHMRMLGGASNIAAQLAGSSVTTCQAAGALTVQAALAGDSVTSYASSGLLTTAEFGPASPMPLPHMALLGGASAIVPATTNHDLTGAGIDPAWLKWRAQGLSESSVALSGTSVTRTQSLGILPSRIGPTGIASGAAISSMTLARESVQQVSPPGIPPGTVGLPVVTTPDAQATVNAGGIDSGPALGVPGLVVTAARAIFPTGIASGAAVGAALLGAATAALGKPNALLEPNRTQAFKNRRAAIVAEPVLLGKTEVDPLLGNQSSAPQQPRKIAGAADTNQVVADYTGAFDALNFVSADFSGAFEALSEVSADYSGVLVLQAMTSADYQGEFESLQVVASEWAGAFDALQEVSQDWTGTFLSDGLLSTVDADYTGAFDVLAEVSQDFSGGFAGLNAVDADYTGSFTVTDTVDADFSGRFDVLQLVHADFEGFYAVGLFGRGITMIPPPYDGRMTPGAFSNILIPTE